jgi:transcriptional regulator with XRE-family HTH domain
MKRRNEILNSGSPPVVTLKAVAQRVGLTPGTVSAVLNNSHASASVPERTRKRILEAARELRYKPNFLARSLRVKRTYTIGVIAQEIGDIYGAMVISGVEKYLRQQNYFFLTVIHRHDPQLLQSYSQLLVSRGAEGIIAVATSITASPSLPTVAIAGHQRVDGVTNITLDHRACRADGPAASGRAGAPGARAHEGSAGERRHRRSLGSDLRGGRRAEIAVSGQNLWWRLANRRFAAAGLRSDERAAQKIAWIYGAVCVQRSGRDRRHSGDR